MTNRSKQSYAENPVKSPSRIMSEDEIKDALYLNKGLVTPAAMYLNCSPSTIYLRLQRSPELKKYQEEILESVKDIAEQKLFNLINEENLRAITYFLSRKAKDRGYGDAQELTVKSQNLNANIDLTKLNEEELLNLEQILLKTQSSESGYDPV